MDIDPPRETRSPARLAFLDDCRECIDDLFRAAREQDGPNTAFMQFIEIGQRFSNLSVFNSMLVAIQRPGAIAVGSRRRWADVGRKVKPGTPPLLILQPFGPVAYVYEYGDTEGKAFDGEQANTLFAEGNLRHRGFEQLVEAAEAYDVLVEFDARNGPLSAGYAHEAISQQGIIEHGTANPRRAWRVVLNHHLDMPSRFATLAHELGHIYCGHLGSGPSMAWPDRRAELTNAERELEAEGVAYIVCLRNGLEPRSASYLSQHIGSADLDKVSMFAIYEAANRIESRTVRAAARKGKPSEPEVVWFPPLPEEHALVGSGEA